jgi:O-antigen ligase
MTSVAYAALWIFVFSVPWERIFVLTGVSLVTRLMGALAVGLALLAVVISGRLRRWRAFHVAALLFVLWAGVGVLVFHMATVPRKFYTFVQLFLVVWMIWELTPSGRRVMGLLLAYVLGSYIAALDTLLLFARQAGALRRFASAGSDPNNLAMTLALALPIAWYLGMTYRQPLLRWICRAYLPIGLLAIGLTGSRGGMITSIVALLIVPLSMTNLSPGRMVTAVAMLGISGALAVTYVPETVIERLATTQESVLGRSLGGRFRLWKAGIHAFTEQPIMGYGTSAFRSATMAELGALTQVAHNSYISVAVEEGFVGLMLFLSMLSAVFIAVLRLPRLERRFALVLLTTLCVAMLPLTWEDQKPVWIVLAVLIAMASTGSGGLGRAQHQPILRRAAPVGASPVAARSGHRTPRVGRPFGRDASA